MKLATSGENTLPDVVYQAQPPLEFIPPALDPTFLRVCQLFLPSLIHWRTAISHIEADNAEVLLDLYHQFQDRKIRFLIAFRHPKAEDPALFGLLAFPHFAKTSTTQGYSATTSDSCPFYLRPWNSSMGWFLH
jgi:hypothetical protein